MLFYQVATNKEEGVGEDGKGVPGGNKFWQQNYLSGRSKAGSSAFTPAFKNHKNSWRHTVLATRKNYCSRGYPKKAI